MLEWWRRLVDRWRREPEVDSDFPGDADWVDRVPHDLGAPDTEPTSPGALDSDDERKPCV